MRKLTRKSLEELAQKMPVLSEEVQRSYIGGGSGTYDSPYTFEEYLNLHNPTQVYYLDADGNLCYDFPDVVVIGQSNCTGNSNYGSGSIYSNSNYGSGSIYSNYGNESGNSYHYGSESNSLFEIINQLANQLPDETQTILFGVNIFYDSTLEASGQYHSYTNVIYLKDLIYDTLYGECVHAVQEKKGYCGDNHAAREYQEHIIRDIMSIYRSYSGDIPYGYKTSNDDHYIRWINSCISERGVNLLLFLGGVNMYIPYFFEYKSNVPQYQGEIPSNYDFNWWEMFKAMGIPTY